MNGGRIRVVLQLLGIGWYVAICIGGGALGGFWLDRQTNLSPVFTLVGLGIGIAVAVFGMYRMLLAVLSSDSKTNDEGNQ